MTIYYGLLIWFILCCFLFNSFRFNDWKLLQFIACFVPALLISACRGITVGTDTLQYVDATSLMQSMGYKGYENSGMYSNYEPGFKLLMYVCTKFSDSSKALIVISSVIIISIPFFVIYKLSNYPALSYVFYFLSTMYYFDLNAMRQTMSIAFLFLVIYEVSKDKKVMAFVYLACAVLFHMTALIFVPVLLLAKHKPKKSILKLTLVGAVFVMIGGRFLPKLFTVISKYNGYASSQYLTSGKTMPFIQIILFGTLLMLFFQYYSSVMSSDVVSKDAKLWNLVTYSSAFMVLIGCSVFYVNVFFRFMYIFLPVFCIILPNFVWDNYLNKKISIHSVVSYLAILVFFLSFLFVPDTWFGINPYVLY